MTAYHSLALILAAKGLLISSMRLTMASMDLAIVAGLDQQTQVESAHRLRQVASTVQEIVDAGDL